MSTDEVGLLVVGAGMAGLTAAARAARDGLSVLVTEIAEDVGGSARFAGYAWTAPSHEVMDRQNPNGDGALKRALVDRFASGVDWIRDTGVETGAAQRILSFGRGHRLDTNHYVDTCRRIVLDAGGTVLLGTDLAAQRGEVPGCALLVDPWRAGVRFRKLPPFVR
jgi:flavin-dependent dehydrogenase